MFRTLPLSIVRSLFTVHSTMVYVIEVCRQLSSRSICVPIISSLWFVHSNRIWWILQYDVPYYVVSSSPSLLAHKEIKIFPSEFLSQRPPLLSETKLHTHTKLLHTDLLWIIIIIIIIYLSSSWATCWPVTFSRNQKFLQESAIISSASWGRVFHYPGWSLTRHSIYMLYPVSLVFQ